MILMVFFGGWQKLGYVTDEKTILTMINRFIHSLMKELKILVFICFGFQATTCSTPSAGENMIRQGLNPEFAHAKHIPDL